MWGNGDIAPHIFNFSIGYKWVSFTACTVYLRGKSLRYPLDKRPGKFMSLDAVKKWIITCLCRETKPSLYTECVTSTPTVNVLSHALVRRVFKPYPFVQWVPSHVYRLAFRFLCVTLIFNCQLRRLKQNEYKMLWPSNMTFSYLKLEYWRVTGEKYTHQLNSKFSQQWLWKVLSSGKWRHRVR